MPPSIALDDARPRTGISGSKAGDVDGTEDGVSDGQGLDSQGGALSTLGLPSSVTPAATVDETHRVALLVRKAGESGAGAGGGSASAPGSMKGKLGSGMWSSLGMRGVSMGGGGGSEGESTSALGGGGFGVDARRYVEGLLSLNR